MSLTASTTSAARLSKPRHEVGDRHLHVPFRNRRSVLPLAGDLASLLRRVALVGPT